MAIRLSRFQKIVWDFYKSHGRHDLSWRETTDPYRILVSELMLQQTQVARVIPKYQAFLKLFPTVKKLAGASQADVVVAWQGLGYNRRAKFLHKAAHVVMEQYKGVFPISEVGLRTLPGVGSYTAAAIATFAYNIPTVFIETNIRRVFIHHFFKVQQNVSDSQLLPYIQKSLDTKNPRAWYWALMDYGASLPKIVKRNPNRHSRHYVKQSVFVGSLRQARGAILRTLALQKAMTVSSIQKHLLRQGMEKEKITQAMSDLSGEGFIVQERGRIRLV